MNESKKKPKKESYRLSEEGERYLKSGLPEMNLVKALKKGPLGFDDARVKVDNFNIALQWAKKNGWVEDRDGVLCLVGEPKEAPLNGALKAVADGGIPEPKVVDVLLQRKLVRRIVRGEVDKLVGKEVAVLTPELLKTGLWRKVKFRPYNVEARGKKMHPGKRQPYNSFLMKVRHKLVELGFKEMVGPTIETEFWNFDALFQPQNHPARDWTQTYNLKYPQYGSLPDDKIVAQVKATHENGWETGATGWGYKWSEDKAAKLMPRAHDTAISPRYLSSGVEIPGKYFNIVRCYRPDVIDATHGVEFNQTGGFVVAEDLTFKNLLGLLKQFASEIAGAKKAKFYPDYYPFTEPSCQISIKHPELGWIEAAGAGIFRTELTEPLGIKAPVIAWGFGIDRLAMHALGINDIRNLFSANLQWLRSQTIVR
jgi:phenylalanyl-tRNA synthetase alpha chain